MAYNGLCYITYDGKKNIGRPSNSFKQALEKSQKSFLGQLRIISNPTNPRCQGLEILRNGQLLLKTLNIHHIRINRLGNTAFELSFFGNKVPEIIEFVDKSVLTGFQMNSTHFVTITIHMHFVNYVRYGNLTKEEQKQYHDMIHDLENTAARNRETRKVAIGSILCNRELLDKISSSTNQQNIRNLVDTFSGRRRNSEVPQQPTADRRLPCTNYECECNTCLLKKQAVKYSLTEEYKRKFEDEMRKKEEEHKEALVDTTLRHAEEVENLNEDIRELHDTLAEREAQIQRQARELQDQRNQFNDLQDRQNRQNQELVGMKRENEKLQQINRQQALEIEDRVHENQQLRQQIQQLQQHLMQQPVQQPVQQVQPQVTREVYVTRTGHRYHSRSSCPGLSRANDVWKEPLSSVERRLTPCLRC